MAGGWGEFVPIHPGVRRAGCAAALRLAAGRAAAAQGPPAAQPGEAKPQPGKKRFFDPRRPIEAELRTSILDGFTLAAVGDCITSRPLAPLLKRDAGFAAVVRLLREADAAFGNFETVAVDVRSTRATPQGGTDDWTLLSLPEVAKDLRALGFDLLSRANNHALDWGIEGMRESSRLLDEAGLVHAGAGEDRGQARAPRYFESEMGRVGLVSFASSFRDLADALPARAAAPGRPGLSALRTTRTTMVTADMMRSLLSLSRALEAGRSSCEPADREAEAAAPGAEAEEPPREMRLFGTTFRLGDRPGYRYEMDPGDLAEILRSIRQGKQHSDFLIATIHAHEQGLGCEPGDFLPALAHAAIDAGADAFIGHGVHVLGPIEIYKGRPILYSLANFFWSDIQEPLPADFYERNRDLLAEALGDPAAATDADLSALLNAQGFDDERVFQTVVAVSRFEGGRLSELRLHPVDLGYGLKLTRSGVPRLASPAAARAILERLQRLSRPYGTIIAIEQTVGVIRPR